MYQLLGEMISALGVSRAQYILESGQRWRRNSFLAAGKGSCRPPALRKVEDSNLFALLAGQMLFDPSLLATCLS